MDYEKKGFEFKLGTLGLVFFTLGISVLLLGSFIFGVMVGSNIESAPEDIARNIPRMIKQRISRTPAAEEPKPAEGQGEEMKKILKGDKDDFKLSFFDTLTRKQEGGGAAVDLKDPKEIPPKAAPREKAAAGKERFAIQVASLQDKGKAEELRGTLIQMGYDPVVDMADVDRKGRWYRVKLKGFETREDARKVAADIERKIKGLQCLVAPQEG